MRVLVNTLSIGSLSGQHVVLGFLSRLIPWTEGEHEFILLHDERSELPDAVLGSHVRPLPVSGRLRNWIRRSVWEATRLPALLRDNRVDLLLNPSGALLPNVSIPQVVLCQNPWCFVQAAQQGVIEAFKARLQRSGYRRALQHADLILFISDHLRTLYRQAAGPGAEAPSDIAYVGVNDETFAAAEALKGRVQRQPHLIVSVSAMARWKGVETLVAAVARLRQQGCPALLKLVGPWPDPAYALQIRRQIAESDLTDAVEITGKVSKETLHRCYAEARVFALLSRCESFGIPAAEAQAFGTPAVVTTGCAMPEVCGDGAITVPPDNAPAAADALQTLLESEVDWSRRSEASLSNVERFRWELTARPFLKMFSLGRPSLPNKSVPTAEAVSA
ncbi:MAG: glycosyltransferase [Planctomycetaceae bacterium]|nr:glycosyltransferase [Planctomycetaceae bacterium]